MPRREFGRELDHHLPPVAQRHHQHLRWRDGRASPPQGAALGDLAGAGGRRRRRPPPLGRRVQAGKRSWPQCWHRLGARATLPAACPLGPPTLGAPLPVQCGAVAEWSKALAWKVSIRQKRIVGSNPTRSATRRCPATPAIDAAAVHFGRCDTSCVMMRFADDFSKDRHNLNDGNSRWERDVMTQIGRRSFLQAAAVLGASPVWAARSATVASRVSWREDRALYPARRRLGRSRRT